MVFNKKNSRFNIPSIDPLSEIERKSPQLIARMQYYEDEVQEEKKFNEEYAKAPLIMKLFISLFLKSETRHLQKYIDSEYNSFVKTRAKFHETLERHSDCYHQVLSYDRQIVADVKLSGCKKELEELWDMFTNGDDYYKNQFMSYFGKYKIELDQAIESAKNQETSG